MRATRRRLAPLIVIPLLAAACISSTSPAPSARPSSRPSVTPTAAVPTPDPTPSPTPKPTLPSKTVTEFGEVWDALPASWPTLPGQTESEVGSDASAMLVVRGDPRALAGRLRAALSATGWTVDVGSPLEDGSIVVDASHPPKGCRAEARFTPLNDGSDLDTLLVYYGSGCPFS